MASLLATGLVILVHPDDTARLPERTATRTVPTPVTTVSTAVRPLVDTTAVMPGASEVDLPRAGQSIVAIMDDAGTARVMAATPDQKPVPIASVAKVMTAYLILRDHPLPRGEQGPRMVVTAEEAGAYARERAARLSVVRLRAGQRLSQRQALQALLIASADNVAHVLARWDAGSSKAFVAKMNAEAEALGMTDTTFTDPSGLDSGTVSTAEDLLKLAVAALQVPELVRIAGTKETSIPVEGRIDNYNTLLGRAGVFGIKTGSTTAAGGCLMFAARRPLIGAPGAAKVTVIGAVLGQPGNLATMLTKVISETDDLVRDAGAEARSWPVVREGDPVAEVTHTLSDGTTRTRRVVAAADLRVLAWPGVSVQLRVDGDPAASDLALRASGDGVEAAVPLREDEAESLDAPAPGPSEDGPGAG